MKRRATLILAAAAVAACLPTAAQAAPADCEPTPVSFGLCRFDVSFTNAGGTPATQAGSHPFAMTTSLAARVAADGLPEGWLRDIVLTQVRGLAGDTTVYPRCDTVEFLGENEGINACPTETALGLSTSWTFPGTQLFTAPVFNLEPPPGVLLRIGFRAVVENVVVDVSLGQDPPYRPVASSLNVPQLAHVYANKTQLWGDPSDPEHDELRGVCGASIVSGGLPYSEVESFQFEADSEAKCPVAPRSEPLLTLPTTCAQALASDYGVLSWEGEAEAGSVLLHDPVGNPQPLTGCGKLGFQPEIGAQPTSRAAQSPTGLDISLEVEDQGLVSVGGLSQSQIRKVVLTLPEGMTANPSVAEGLEVCSEAALGRETLHSAPGEGCPQASKLGTIEVESPLVGEPVRGAMYQAEPYENEFGSLLAFYFVLKSPELGIVVKQAAKVEPDPRTGQIVGITDEIPQLPFSSFRLHFREGGRSPLVTPPTCGTHEAKATITPWSGTAAIESSSTFTIVSGPDEGPCPPGGTPPFAPGFEAGSANNAAGAYSPFAMRLTRRDGDQDLVRFDATLPPGVVAKLAGVSRCPDAKIALAKAKTGRAELAAPSCPANSKIGAIQSGAGVGSQLTYVPGTLYLAGPFGGAPLSAVGVVPAVAGPFDVGTVVVRQALRVDPRSAVVTADGARSDPIPHILAGIPLVVRDVQVSVDRPGFTLNPTDCDPFATEAQIWGGGGNPFATADDSPVSRAARYQAADCARLAFEPRLFLKLKGGTGRGAHPRLRAVLRPHEGDANLEQAVVRLPRSAFLEQAHIRTICTRVQYAAENCPAGAVYGRVRAFTPLLDEPLEGPVYLRSSSHNLPDLVFALHGLVDLEAVGRIDSERGGIRTTFTQVPDAPVSRVVLRMQGGRKGLIVNSTDLCARKHRLNAGLDAHNGRRATLRSVVRASCSKRKAGGSGR